MNILMVSIGYAKYITKLSRTTFDWSLCVAVILTIIGFIVMGLDDDRHPVLFWGAMMIMIMSYVMPMWNIMDSVGYNDDVLTNVTEYYQMRNIKRKYPHPAPYSKSLNKYNKLHTRYRNATYDSITTSVTPKKPQKWQRL